MAETTRIIPKMNHASFPLASMLQLSAMAQVYAGAAPSASMRWLCNSHVRRWRNWSNEPGIGNGRPFDETKWVHRTAARLGLDFTLRPRGRPKLDDE